MRKKEVYTIANGKWETYLKIKKRRMEPPLVKGQMFLDVHTRTLYAGIGNAIIKFEGIPESIIGKKGQISPYNVEAYELRQTQ